MATKKKLDAAIIDGPVNRAAEHLAALETTTAKIEEPVLREARVVASYRGITLTEYLTEMIRPIVRRDLAREQAKKMKEAEGGKS